MGCGASKWEIKGEPTCVSILDENRRQKVHGVVEAPPTPEDGTPFAAMVSGVECVYCRATVTKVMPDGQVQTYTEEHGINFVVTDDTGSVMVKPAHMINWEDGIRDECLTQIRFKNEKEGERTWEPGIKRPEAMSNEFEGAAKRSSRRHRGIISGAIL